MQENFSTSTALNALGEPMPVSESEALARQLVRELNEYTTLGLPCDARYDAKSAQVRALGFDLGPDAAGALCLYDNTSQRPLMPNASVARAWDALAEQSPRDAATTQAGLRAFASLPVDPALLARAIAALRLLAPEAPSHELECEASLLADELVKATRPEAGEWGTRRAA